ncbi:MAG: hypothetical protein ACFFCV_07495 [Promethearchaeota archaeon]
MPKNQQIDNSNENKGDIFIKKEAFRNMLTHVLRFGSNALEKSVEVLGVCLGKYDPADESIIIENAVPITHGDKVEIGFDKEMYELFVQIGNKYSLPLIGYYHSHPSWGLYLSESDLTNIQFFQNDKFPKGFCIVFDHTLIGKNGNLGFEIYRLDKFSKTDKYHTVPFEVEIPNSLEYFKWVQKFSEDFQKKNPILIKEINEFAEPVSGDLQEIPGSDDLETIEESTIESLELTALDSGFYNGTEKLSEMFLDITKNQMGNWIKDIDQGTSKGSEYISKAVNKMQDAISSGLTKVDTWFNKTMNNAIKEFKKSVSNYVNSRVDRNKEIIKDISNIKEKFSNNLKIVFEESISPIRTKMENLANLSKGTVEKNNQTILKFDDKLNTFNSLLIDIEKQLNSTTQYFEKKIEDSKTTLNTNIDEKTEKLNTELNQFKEFNNEINSLLEKLQKAITGFRNLT